MAEIIAKKTVVEVRFAPALRFFAAMDSIGEALLEEMGVSSWARSPHTLEIQDRTNLERISLEPKRIFADFDSGGERQKNSVTRGVGWIQLALARLELERVERVGIRQWFAIEIAGADEKKLIKKLLTAYARFGDLEKAGKMLVRDIALTLELVDRTDPLKEGRLVLGAMGRDQWPQFVPYGSSDSGSGYLGENDRRRIIAALPLDFIFIDIDKRLKASGPKDGVSLEKVLEFATAVERDQKQLAQQVLTNIREV